MAPYEKNHGRLDKEEEGRIYREDEENGKEEWQAFLQNGERSRM